MQSAYSFIKHLDDREYLLDSKFYSITVAFTFVQKSQIEAFLAFYTKVSPLSTVFSSEYLVRLTMISPNCDLVRAGCGVNTEVFSSIFSF